MATITFYQQYTHSDLNVRVTEIEQKVVKFTTKLKLGGETSRVKYRVVPSEDHHGKFNAIKIISIDGKNCPILERAAIEILEPIHNS